MLPPIASFALALVPAQGQEFAAGPGAPAPVPPGGPVAVIPGQVNDLAPALNGKILYCTEEGEMGAIDPLRTPAAYRREVWADAASGPFPNALRAVAMRSYGQAYAIDLVGDIYRIVEGVPGAVKVYSDLFMVRFPTDLVIDQRGNFLATSRTPSNGVRAVNFISGDGQRWDYHVVKHSPIALVADPLSDDLIIADDAGGGAIRAIDGTDETHPTFAIDTTTLPGFQGDDDDGDLVCEADGDFYFTAGGTVYFHDRALGMTSPFASGYDLVRGIVIAPSTPGAASATGWSLFLADGAGPTLIRELPGVGAPASATAADQGIVPDRGTQVATTQFQMQVLARDNDGTLLIGGSAFGANPEVSRFDPATGTRTTIAGQADGISDTVEGLAVAPDDTIFALTRSGNLHAITEDPLSVTTLFTDPTNLIQSARSLGLGTGGEFYVADRNSWNNGDLIRIDGGVATLLLNTTESTGIAADPAGGGLFLTQWNGAGFNGTVERYDLAAGTLTPLPGFAGINYSNGTSDGDTVVDANGSIYTCAEDEWSVLRYDPEKAAFARVASGQVNHLSGVAIAASTPGANSGTGWSLYISEHFRLFEIGGVAGPATQLIDAAPSFRTRPLATLRPEHGRPLSLAQDEGEALYVGTAAGTILSVDADGGGARAAATLPGAELVGLWARPGGGIYALDAAGAVHRLRATHHGLEPLGAFRATPALARQLGRRLASGPDAPALRRAGRRFLLDGWSLYAID